VGPEAVLLSAMAGLGENPLAFAVESSRTAAPVTRQRVKSDRTPSDWYRYAGMAELADATDLKFRAAIRWNTMFPPALKGWNDPAPPVPRPRACPPPHPSRSRRAPTAPLKLTSLKPYTSASLQHWTRGRGGMADAADLRNT